jgi:FG-GAP-like repeat
VAIWGVDPLFLNVRSVFSLGAVPNNWVIAGAADFSGDARADILWRDRNTGTVAIWLLAPFGEGTLQVSQSGALGTVPSNWVIAGTGDFDGDGKHDILWRDSNTGTVAIWFMNGLQISQTGSLGAVPTNWVIAATGDFNGNRRSDILWRDTSSGAVAIWFLDGLQVTHTAFLGTVPMTWTIQGLNVD